MAQDFRAVCLAFGNIADVALYDLDAFAVISIADELNRDFGPGLCLKRKIVVADIALRLQFLEHLFALLNIRERAHFPQFLSQKLGMGVTKHIDQVGIDVFDLCRAGVQQQYAVLRGFKQPAVAAFGYPQRFKRDITRLIDSR